MHVSLYVYYIFGAVLHILSPVIQSQEEDVVPLGRHSTCSSSSIHPSWSRSWSLLAAGDWPNYSSQSICSSWFPITTCPSSPPPPRNSSGQDRRSGTASRSHHTTPLQLQLFLGDQIDVNQIPLSLQLRKAKKYGTHANRERSDG